MSEIVKDPVCHMEVAATSFATKYADIAYAFCSAQCKERFLAKSAAAFCYQRRLMRYRLYACGGVLMAASFIASSIFDTGRANRKRCSDVR